MPMLLPVLAAKLETGELAAAHILTLVRSLYIHKQPLIFSMYL